MKNEKLVVTYDLSAFRHFSSVPFSSGTHRRTGKAILASKCAFNTTCAFLKLSTPQTQIYRKINADVKLLHTQQQQKYQCCNYWHWLLIRHPHTICYEVEDKKKIFN